MKDIKEQKKGENPLEKGLMRMYVGTAKDQEPEKNSSFWGHDSWGQESKEVKQ